MLHLNYIILHLIRLYIYVYIHTWGEKKNTLKNKCYKMHRHIYSDTPISKEGKEKEPSLLETV